MLSLNAHSSTPRETFHSLLLSLTWLLFAAPAAAIDCPQANLTLFSDGAGFPQNCDRIQGSLTIHPGATSLGLTALSDIQHIGENLIIDNTDALTNLSGLDHLESIGGNLEIRRSAQLANIDALTNLTDIGGYLLIDENSLLANVDGLDSLLTIGNFLTLSDNDALVDVDGLASLVDIGTGLGLSANAVLDNIAGLSSLTGPLDSISITEHPSLKSLTGLAGLQPTAAVTVEDNDLITDLDGLDGVSSISGILSIKNNASLASLDGLDSLTSAGQITIEGNLALLSLSGLANLQTVSARLSLNNNPLLADVSSLGGLREAGTLAFNRLDALQTLPSFSQLTTLPGGGLFLEDNDSLTSLAGLNALESLGSLTVRKNDSLIDLTGLGNVETIDSSLIVTGATSYEGLNKLRSAGSIDPTNGSRIFGRASVGLTPSFTGLETLETITGDIFMLNWYGNDFSGLDNLETIGGDLLIFNPARALSFAGLDKLRQVDELIIEFTSFGGGAPLRSVEGFNSLEAAGKIEIRTHGSLETIDGFRSLRTVAEGLWIENLPELQTILGFDVLESLGELRLVNNPKLTTIDAFELLTDIGTAGFRLLFNSTLPDITGFENLTRVDGFVDIQGNELLTTMDWLAALESVGGSFTFEDNDIADCTGLRRAVDSRDDGSAGPGAPPTPDIGGSIAINRNASGCNNLTSIVPDGDGDGVSDYIDAFPDDFDNDGASDDADAFPQDPNETLDSDGDGLGDNRERELGTRIDLADSDGDGFTDAEEVNEGTDPNSAADVPEISPLNIILIKAAIDASG